MSEHDKHHPDTPTQASDTGKTAGENTQSQGGIGHHAAASASKSVNPQAGSPKGAVDMPGPSLDSGGGADPRDGRAHSGFTGDDGAHQATDSAGTAASLQPGSVGDLGAQQDQRVQGMPTDPAERTTGADTPNKGGVAGAPGGPSKETGHIPGQDEDEDGTTGGGQSGNDRQRDSQM